MIGHTAIRNDFGHLLEKGGLHHAYLLFGPASVGKFHFARTLAAFIETGEWTSDQLRPLSDVFIIPKTGTSIGIDESRKIKQFLSEKPFISTRRTVIIENAAQLTTEAQNALLKVAEEPPDSALLILVLADPESLMPTLVSRFQKVYMGTVSTEEMREGLLEMGYPAKEVEKAIKTQKGKPGTAINMLKGGEEDENIMLAKRFLEAKPSERKDLLKEITSPEEFSFKSFLNALIEVLSSDEMRNVNLWHAVLELRSISDSTGLSPSIQLRNLWAKMG